MSRFLVLTGRALLALYFLVPGLAKILTPESQLALMKSRNLPLAEPLLFFAGAASIVGAGLLFTGRYVRFAALGFVVYVLLVNALLHDFWNLEGASAARELQNFIKNLGILAGLLVLAGQSRVRWPRARDWWRSDNAAD